MDTYEIIYIIAISLQACGALVLLLHFVSIKRENVIRSFIGNGLIIYNGFENKLEYNHERFISYYKALYLNKFAFFYILVGYILSLFGKQKIEDYKWYYFFGFICISILLLNIAYIVSSKLASKDRIKAITKEELDNLEINIQLNTAGKKDFDNVFKGERNSNEIGMETI